MSWFKNTITPIPKEADMPIPNVQTQDEPQAANGLAVSEYAPKRYHIQEQDEAYSAIEKAVSVLNNHKAENAALKEQLNDVLVQNEVQRRRIDDLEFTIAQLTNERTNAFNGRDDAVKNQQYAHGFIMAIAAMADDYRTHGPTPLPRKRARKAIGGENGTEGSGVALAAETPIGEAPKAEGTGHGEAQEK